MMFSKPYRRYEPTPQVVKALSRFLILHADHEQNCSTSTVRTVGSSGANVFASVASGVCALWGPLHGGANMAVIEMLQKIHSGGESPKSIVEKVKRPQVPLDWLWPPGLQEFDPRAKILEKTARNCCRRSV